MNTFYRQWLTALFALTISALAAFGVDAPVSEYERQEQLSAIVSEALGLPVKDRLQSSELIYAALGLTRKWDADCAVLELFVPKKFPYGVSIEKKKSSTRFGNVLRISFHWQPTKDEPTCGVILSFYYKDGALEDMGVNRTAFFRNHETGAEPTESGR